MYSNNIVNFPAIIEVLTDIAICRKCQKGELELFELRNLLTCSTQLMFRCNECLEIFMNVPIRAVPKPTPDDISKEKIYYPLDYSATLASIVVGIGTEKLNTLYGLLDIPPSPT